MRRISENIEKVLNYGLTLEQEAVQVYMALGYYNELIGYLGAGTYFKDASNEERTHLHKVLQYMIDMNVMPEIPPAVMPPLKFESLKHCLEVALNHEQRVTAFYKNAYSEALKEKDHLTSTFLHWFLEEQIEEESKLYAFLDRIESFGETKDVLYMLDKEMGTK